MFGKRIEQITFDDVVTFLKEMRREGLHLDYKAQGIDPKKLAKLACAFANTEGGFIIFGVNEADELPVPPFAGGPLGPDIAQEVKQACRSLSPQVEPIVGQVLRNPTDPNKSFLVVAIPQSGKAPHLFSDNDSQYMFVKAADHKEPVQPTLEVYRLLAKNRKRILKIRQAIEAEHEMQLSRFQNDLAAWAANRAVKSEIVDLGISRAYPDGEDIVTPQEIVERIEQFKTNIWTEEFKNARLPTHNLAMATFERGILWVGLFHNIGFDLTFDCRGFLTLRAAIPHHRLELDQARIVDWIVPEVVCAAMYGMLKMGLRLFETCGCNAALNLRCQIKGGNLQDPTYGPRRILLPAWRRAAQGDDKDIEVAWLRGPGLFPVDVQETIPWCDSRSCSELAHRILRRYVSSFNVSDSGVVKSISEGMIAAVDGP